MPDYTSLRNGLVGAWCPSLGASGYKLLDRSGYGNHGTLTNMDAGTDWVASGSGLALDFDGSNDYVELGTGLAQGGNFSVVGWCNVQTGYGNNPQICSRAKFGGLFQQNWMLFIRTDDGTHEYALQTTNDAGTRYQIKGGGLVQTNTWTQVCASYEVNGAKLYINGNPVTVTTIGTPNATPVSGQNVNIGAYVSVTNFFKGQLDDIRLYNRALSPSEIQLLYTGGRGVGLQATRKRVYGFVGVTNVSLTPNNIAAGNPAVGTTTLSQVHALTADGITAGTPSVGSSSLTQNHALTASDLTAGYPVVGDLTLVQAGTLQPNNIAAGTPVVGSPALTQNEVLTAIGITAGSPSVATTALNQTHVTAPIGLLAGVPVFGATTLSQNHAVSLSALAAGSPTLGTPTVFSGTTILYVRVNGVWKAATPFVRVNGAWKAATPYTKVNGVWK